MGRTSVGLSQLESCIWCWGRIADSSNPYSSEELLVSNGARAMAVDTVE